MTRSLRFLLPSILIPGIALIAMISCSGSGKASASTAPGSSATPLTAQSNEGAPGQASPLIGETCRTGDPNHLCLGSKWVTYTDASGTPVLTKQQAITNIGTMNQLWAQCDIGFQIEEYDAVDPTASSLAFGAESEDQLEQIRATFVNANTLLAVTTGPWDDTINAWTAMPGGGPYGAVMEQSIVNYGNGIVYAHEFGHYLGLEHVPDAGDMMDAIIYLTSDTISPDECATARQTAQGTFAAMLR